MSKLSQLEKLIELLKRSPTQRFTARQIAEGIVSAYPEDYREKQQNPRFADQRAFLSQIVAEIGSQKTQIEKKDKHVFWQDKPRPRVYWYDRTTAENQKSPPTSEDSDDEEETSEATSKIPSEHDLYPILIDYLKAEIGLYCQRIDERRSANSRGTGGNQWV